MTRWPRPCLLAAWAALALTWSGCSLLFTNKAPDAPEKLPARATVECTTSVVAPVIDSIIGSYQVVRTGMAIKADESDYGDNPTISREMDIAFGATLAVLFASSAIYGFGVTNECRDVKERRASVKGHREEPEEDKYERPEPDDADEDEDPPPRASRTRRPRKTSASKAVSPATP